MRASCVHSLQSFLREENSYRPFFHSAFIQLDLVLCGRGGDGRHVEKEQIQVTRAHAGSLGPYMDSSPSLRLPEAALSVISIYDKKGLRHNIPGPSYAVVPPN